jgi:hypothetical protein
MAGLLDLTQDDLENVFPANSVRQTFCDNGSQKAGKRLDAALAIARRELDAVLLKGWTLDQIVTLVAEDPAIKVLALRLVMAEGAALKPEWSGPNAPYADLRADTMKTLELLAAAQKRSAGETIAGMNPNARGAVSPPTPCFVFAPSRDRPFRRGY